MDDLLDLRSDLVALAVADPEALADILVGLVGDHPQLRPMLAHLVDRQCPSRLHLNTHPPLPPPSPTLLAAVRAQLLTIKARTTIRYRTPCVCGGVVAELGVRKGDEAALLGGVLVGIAPLAAMIAAMGGGDVPAALALLAHAVAEQLGGPVTRRSLAINHNPKPAQETPPRQAALRDPDDAHHTCLLLVASYWPPASDLPRRRHERNDAFLMRILAELRRCAGPADPTALAALDHVRRAFPQFME